LSTAAWPPMRSYKLLIVLPHKMYLKCIKEAV